jgi:hypothetical protein
MLISFIERQKGCIDLICLVKVQPFRILQLIILALGQCGFLNSVNHFGMFESAPVSISMPLCPLFSK